MPIIVPASLSGIGTIPTRLAKNIMAMTDTIEVKIYEPKKLVVPFEILEAVSKVKLKRSFA